MATCNCVSIELLNSQLTQLGQTLWISNYPCGGPSTVSQAWNVYPYDMFPAGPTIYICTPNLGSISYQYGIAGTPVIGIPSGAIQTVGGVCTSVNDCYEAPAVSPSPTQTKTPTNTPTVTRTPTMSTCSEWYWETITNGSNIFYTNCLGQNITFFANFPGSGELCVLNGTTPTYQTPGFNILDNTYVSCLSPIPTPTNTPTKTTTPTVTRTPNPTPSTTPIVCGSGTTTGTHTYYDCCGNLIQGSDVGTIILLDYTKPSTGVVKLNVPTSVICATPTPTPTPSPTPNNCMYGITDFTSWYYTDCCGTYVSGTTMGLSICYDDRFAKDGIAGPYAPCSTICVTPTPTTTPTNTQTPTPTRTPSTSMYYTSKNECEVFTLLDMGVQCYPITVPTSQTSNDGILSVQVTGGTAPYSFYWGDGQRTQTLVGVSQNNYEITVVDYYGDYTATTVCSLFPISPTPTSTLTPTPTNTPAPVYPDLCLIYVSSTISYGPIQFIWNGNSANSNGKPTWSATYNQTQLDIEWSTQNLRWEIQGWSFTSGIPVSVNTSDVPDSGWSMAGGQQAQLSMTQGDCPAYLPLMSVPTAQNQTCPANLNGSITLMTNYGVPPYEYSINGGNSYQLSNVFQGLSSSTYTVITKDSATPSANTLSNTVVISSLGQNANYTIGVVVVDEVNLGPGSQMDSWRVNITPPLPVGTSISFYLSVNDIKAYYLPGTGTIEGTTVVKKNNVTLTGLAGQSSTPLVTAPRAFCSPYTSGTTTFNQLYYLTVGNGDVVSGTSLSNLVITNGLVGANSCATKLEQSILINTVSPIITGGVCNSVTNNPQSQGINYHTITQGNIPCTGTKWINWTGTTGGNFALDGGGTILLNSTSSSPTTIQSVFGYERLVCTDKNPNTTAQGINTTGTYTYTFSQPVLNPLLSIYSLGRSNPGPITVTMSANTPFSIYCNTVSNPDYQIVYNLPNQTFSGDEGYGIIQFSGLVSQIVLSNLGPNENYTQLTWGLPCVDP